MKLHQDEWESSSIAIVVMEIKCCLQAVCCRHLSPARSDKGVLWGQDSGKCWGESH